MPPKKASKSPTAPPNTPSKRSLAAQKAAKTRKDKAEAEWSAYKERVVAEASAKAAKEEGGASAAAMTEESSGSSQKSNEKGKKIAFAVGEDEKEKEKDREKKGEEEGEYDREEADDESNESESETEFLENLNEALEEALGEEPDSEVEDDEECYWPDIAQDAELREILKLVMYGGHSTFDFPNWVDEDTRALIPGTGLLFGNKPTKEELSEGKETDTGPSEEAKGDEEAKTLREDTSEGKKGDMELEAREKLEAVVGTGNKRRASPKTETEEDMATASHGKKRMRFKATEVMDF